MGRIGGHHNHVLRIGGLLVVGFTAFVVLRWALIPEGFGVYGFYRAGALDDNMRHPAAYAGESLCVDCHGEVAELRREGGHGRVSCEACHGPVARHASGDFEIRPRALNPRLLCLGCHATLEGKPGFLPQIVEADHFDGPCAACHRPHKPAFDVDAADLASGER